MFVEYVFGVYKCFEFSIAVGRHTYNSGEHPKSWQGYSRKSGRIYAPIIISPLKVQRLTPRRWLQYILLCATTLGRPFSFLVSLLFVFLFPFCFFPTVPLTRTLQPPWWDVARRSLNALCNFHSKWLIETEYARRVIANFSFRLAVSSLNFPINIVIRDWNWIIMITEGNKRQEWSNENFQLRAVTMIRLREERFTRMSIWKVEEK